MEDVLEEILQDEIMDEDDVVTVRPTRGYAHFTIVVRLIWLSSFRDLVKTGTKQINPSQLKAVYGFLSTTLTEFLPSIVSEEAFKYPARYCVNIKL